MIMILKTYIVTTSHTKEKSTSQTDDITTQENFLLLLVINTTLEIHRKTSTKARNYSNTYYGFNKYCLFGDSGIQIPDFYYY